MYRRFHPLRNIENTFYSNTTMKNSNVELATIIFQSFAIFLAISVLLGRVYFLTYYEKLGVPTSEVRLNVIEYAVISPDVTILGVGIAIITALIFWWSKANSTPAWRKDRIIIGCGLLLIGFVPELLEISVLSTRESQSYFPGFYALRKLLTLSILMTAGAILASGSPSLRGDSTDTVRTRSSLRLFVPLLITLVAVWVLMLASSNAISIGESDAERTLQQSPEAIVEFESSEIVFSLCQNSNGHKEDYTTCAFRVVFIGNHYVYLKPSESMKTDVKLYAFPINDIKGITYVLNLNGN